MTGDGSRLFVFRNESNTLVLRFLHQDFEAGKQHVIEKPRSAPVFGGAPRNWTRAEFFVFEQIAQPGR